MGERPAIGRATDRACLRSPRSREVPEAGGGKPFSLEQRGSAPRAQGFNNAGAGDVY